MHSNNEFGCIKSPSLLGIRQIPYPAQDFIGQPGAFKNLFSGFTCISNIC